MSVFNSGHIFLALDSTSSLGLCLAVQTERASILRSAQVSNELVVSENIQALHSLMTIKVFHYF